MGISADLSSGVRGLPRVGVDLATPAERQGDQARAMQDAAARTQEDLPRAGEQLRNLPGALDRFAADKA
jgi:hypothetical protein